MFKKKKVMIVTIYCNPTSLDWKDNITEDIKKWFSTENYNPYFIWYTTSGSDKVEFEVLP